MPFSRKLLIVNLSIRLSIQSILKQYRQAVLSELRVGHQGIVKTTNLTRSYVWRPNLIRDIEVMSPCLKTGTNPARVPLHQWEYPSALMGHVHIDIMGPFKGIHLFIMVDAYIKGVKAQKGFNKNKSTRVLLGR